MPAVARHAPMCSGRHLTLTISAQAAVGPAVDDLVVEHGAFGAHAANDTYGFHNIPT